MLSFGALARLTQAYRLGNFKVHSRLSPDSDPSKREGNASASLTWLYKVSSQRRYISELFLISPRMDRIFSTATLKQYFKDKGLGFRAEILGLGLGWFRVNLVYSRI